MTAPKSNVKPKTRTVRKAAEGCPSMSETVVVALHDVVAAATQHGAVSQVKGKGLLQDLAVGWQESVMAARAVSSVQKDGDQHFHHPWKRL